MLGNDNAAKDHTQKEKKKSKKRRVAQRPHKPLKLNKKEYGMLMHTIGSNYGQFESKIGKSCGIAMADCFYMFDNRGYVDYTVYKRIKIEGNKEKIKEIRGH